MLFENDLFDLAGKVRAVAQSTPDRVAVIEPTGRDAAGKREYRHYTYAQLSEDAESVAVGLRDIGINELTRTVFMAPPSYEGCVVYTALTRVGATIIMIDPSVGLRNVGERLRRLSPEAFVGIPLAHVARVIFGWGPRLVKKAILINPTGVDASARRDEGKEKRTRFPGAHTVASLRRPAPPEPTPANVRPDDPMTVLYTTGSTGPAKPALYTHRNFSGVFRIAHHSWGITESDEIPVDMAVFPAFFIIGLSAGGTVVVPPIQFVREPPAKTDPAPLVEVINDCHVRSLFGSPIILENMARYAESHGITMPTLEVIIGGGAPITGPAMAALTKAMPNGEVYSNYGATEALPSTAHSAAETLSDTWAKTVEGAGICVGRPFPGVEMTVAAIQDGAATEFEEVAPGEIGELLVKSPHISERYLDDPESTRKNKIGDWHRLGDAGYIDDAGRFWVVGRVGHRVRGPNGPLFPLLAEPIFNAHPKVKRTGLVGVPSGPIHRPVLCVETATPLDATARNALRDELLALAASHDASRDIDALIYIDRLPVDPRHNSKIDRPNLAKWAARQLRS